MNNDLQKKLSKLEDCIGIQKNSLSRGYMHGMLNGMIFAHAIFADCDPRYAKLPHRTPTRINVRHKSRQTKLRQK